MIFKKKSKGIVGLDLGSSTLKLVELRRKGDRYHLDKVGIAPLAPEAIVDGAIMDSSLVVDSISQLFNQLGVKNQSVGISISGHAVIIKRITLPIMSPEELAESIQWEAEQYIPFDINDVNLSYTPLGDEPDGQNMAVLLVVAKKDKVTDYTGSAIQAGKTVVLVDVDAFALQNSFEMNYGLGPDANMALVNIGANIMNVNIIISGESVFWRDISFGGNQYTEAIMREMGLSWDQAEALKKGEKIEGFTHENVIPICNTVTEELVQELRKTLDFFQQSLGQGDINHLYLAGGASKTVNLVTLMQERLGIGVEIMNPLKEVSYDESKFDPEWLNDLAPHLGVSVGLAIREVGD
ncbi:MAG TPA: type IV pilus assembly protein PilM [Thermoanaerobaculia bacterium]|nr:type IV pilus assembly protein PilM [Thermoanaerobaculia bacterium]HUM30472.1 type IV pilus assembly protein PilM [Thermoanaerobaculia bacterium]HXK68661.1 type IV pilus assembly protein PilM [Thermoanaerobaculia bacterium]